VTYPELRDWLVAFVAETLEVAPAEVNTDATWDDLGIDSASIIVLLANLQDGTGLVVRPVQVLDHPTIEQLSIHLAALREVA
jgi:acyl carrier protein